MSSTVPRYILMDCCSDGITVFVLFQDILIKKCDNGSKLTLINLTYFYDASLTYLIVINRVILLIAGDYEQTKSVIE